MEPTCVTTHIGFRTAKNLTVVRRRGLTSKLTMKLANTADRLLDYTLRVGMTGSPEKESMALEKAICYHSPLFGYGRTTIAFRESCSRSRSRLSRVRSRFRWFPAFPLASSSCRGASKHKRQRTSHTFHSLNNRLHCLTGLFE